MTLAIFDLDNTLIGGDSDHLWGEFVCEQGLVDSTGFAERNEQFYRDYQEGTLDIGAYLRFALGPLRGRAEEELRQWHAAFMRDKIEPILLPAAQRLLADHRARGHQLLIVTATNRFITGPIAARLGVPHLLASEAEVVNGYYTGEPTGTPTFQHGKVQRLRCWLAEQGADLADSWCYSDSHNDLPLLEAAAHPVAVDPDPRLRRAAEDRGWPVISLREP